MGDEVRTRDRLRADDERVGHVPADRIVVHPHRDVGDRGVEVLARELHEVAAPEPEARLIKTGQQDFSRLKRALGIAESERGIGVEDRSGSLDPEAVEDRLRHLDPAQRGVAGLVAIDDLADARQVLRRGDGDGLGARLDALADGLEQPAAARHLVHEREHDSAVAPVDVDGDLAVRKVGCRLVGHCLVTVAVPPPAEPASASAGTSCSRRSFSSPMIACRAPGTPNSYGPPTTRGI